MRKIDEYSVKNFASQYRQIGVGYMNRREFINELKVELENDLDRAEVHSQVEFYQAYIDDEVKKGRHEQDVVDELGDPFAIARTVVDTLESEKSRTETGGRTGQREAANQSGNNHGYNQQGNNQGYQDPSRRTVQFGTSSRWGCWLYLIIFILILFVVGSLLGAIASVLMPILIPVILVLLAINLWKNFSGR